MSKKRIATIYKRNDGMIIIDDPVYGPGDPRTPEQAWNTLERMLGLTIAAMPNEIKDVARF